MNAAGQTVQVLSVRPGERLYGGAFEVVVRATGKRMMLREHLGTILEIEAYGDGILSDDALSGPPTVLVTEYAWEKGNQKPRKDTYDAYYYEFGSTVLLISI